MSTGSFPLTPTSLQVADEVLDDLRRRLTTTKWPRDAGNDDGYYGVRRSYLQELVAYWADGFDWRAAERAINAYEHYRVEVGGVPVHFMRRPGVGADPVPLILSHGWPWTFWHWAKVIDPLADPAAFGADPADAFEVIVPSLPGFGFSTPLTFAVHLAAHVLAPSTLAYGLADSPAGMLAWMLERWANWSDNGGDVERVFTKDDLLTHATIYWAGDAIETSIRTHANNNRYPWTPSHDRWPQVEAPTGITLVGYENPPGVTTSEQRVQHFLSARGR